MAAATVQVAAKASPGRAVAATISIFAGMALCYLGLGQTVAGFLQLRADGVATSPQGLQAAISAAERADYWWSEPSNSFAEGALMMRLAAPAGGVPYDHALLEAARLRFERSLAQGPAAAKTWAALADARLLHEGPSPAAVEALALSIQLARFEPSLLAWRCEMGLTMYDALDTGRRAALAEQIRMLERDSDADLVRIGRATGRLAVVITALADDNKALRRFQDTLRYVK